MHLLLARSGTIDDGSAPVDLDQSPGDIVVLSAAASELALIAEAYRTWRRDDPARPTLRLANLLELRHNYSIDLYLAKTLSRSRLVVLRVLGGRAYWAYGIDEVAALARAGRFGLVVLPGDDKPDPSLEGLSTVAAAARLRLWECLSEGGAENATAFLDGLAAILEGSAEVPAARPVLKAGLYHPRIAAPTLEALRAHWREGAPVAALVFYRALMLSGDLGGIDGLKAGLEAEGFNVLPVFVASLRDPVCAETVRAIFRAVPPDVIVNTTAFAAANSGEAGVEAFADTDCVVLQAILSAESEAAWARSARGLSPHYVAMHVSLPELDGRILTRAVSFRGEAVFDPATEHGLARSAPKADRIDHVARLAAGWARLRRTPPATRRIAIVLANYPNRDARLANGVGLDTPQSAVRILAAMRAAGYRVDDLPASGEELIARLKRGPTNAAVEGRDITERLPLGAYRAHFEALPEATRTAVHERWGAPEADPFFRNGAFAISALRLGNVVLGVQPARGYNIDPKGTYHDPDLPPPHGYLAFYAWLRTVFQADALVHLGKHGNLEWLPGKALALSGSCFPEAALGPLPNIYPFIVNDPGEGAQAKRRTAAVIIDHLTPPLTRAETYGPLRELEALVDEYYEAAGLDERRRRLLAGEIIAGARRLGLDRDCGIAADAPEAEALAALDNHLCELKELQIRDGLHVFGCSPQDGARADLLAAIARAPRGDDPAQASILRALAEDLGLGFDPLLARLGEIWAGPRPAVLARLLDETWRTAGDTVERLEVLARKLIEGTLSPEPDWRRTIAVLDWISGGPGPALDRCGETEIAGLMRALEGRFVAPGPSGAPTRGRPDVLPTGRNFFSLDSRTLPTQAAWRLGTASAEAVVERYVQDHGEWPRALALSAWGTANMRTGGDDIAQALALLGVRPTWEPASGRVTGFEIIPLAALGRPRVDVTLRVSGFFRDAFPAQIDLIDSAVRAVAELDEPEEDNPLRACVEAEAAALIAAGIAPDAARRRAAIRIFSSRPGAYGAGLQALIDEGIWDNTADLADAYLEWGQYAYGGGRAGEAERDAFARRLSRIDAVLHNQDNREHDLLDSDDYYQFEGGLAASVKALRGQAVRVYHNDHSRPERPVVRALEEEIGRIVRGRAANPKWIAGVMRHGYKGAFEIAATVDYLFAFAATTGAVADHHFDALYDAYLEDEGVRAFLAAHNADALADIAARFAEAIARGLWSPRRNSVHRHLALLAEEHGRLQTEA